MPFPLPYLNTWCVKTPNFWIQILPQQIHKCAFIFPNVVSMSALGLCWSCIYVPNKSKSFRTEEISSENGYSDFPKMLDWLADCGHFYYNIIYIYINIFFFIAGAILSATWPCLWRRCFAFAAAFALALWLSILGRYLGLAQNRKNIGEFVGECGYDKHKKKVWQESNPWELKKLWSDAMKSLWATSCFYLSDQAFSVYSSKLWISQCVTNE